MSVVLAATMAVDRVCSKGGGTQTFNCVGTIYNLSSAALTVTSFIVNKGPAGSAASHGVPLGAPYANNIVPANGTLQLSWAESFLNSSPGALPLVYQVGFTAVTSDLSVVVSPLASVSVYPESAPPSSTAAAPGSTSFLPPPGANTPTLPQQAQLWFEDTPQSGLIPLLTPW